MFLKQILSVMMCLVMLISATPLAITKMVCLDSGDASYSLSKSFDCCGEEEEMQGFSSTGCCAYFTGNFFTAPSFVVKALDLKTSFVPSAIEILHPQDLKFNVIKGYDQDACFFESPVPLGLPPILDLTSILLI